VHFTRLSEPSKGLPVNGRFAAVSPALARELEGAHCLSHPSGSKFLSKASGYDASHLVGNVLYQRSGAFVTRVTATPWECFNVPATEAHQEAWERREGHSQGGAVPNGRLKANHGVRREPRGQVRIKCGRLVTL